LTDSKVFHSMPADSDTLVVSFSAKDAGPGQFHLYKLLESIPLAKLLVRDPSGNWFNAGLPGVGDTVEEIAAAIEQEAARFGAARIVTNGSSMGGYAAILFGCLLGVERVVALAPQTLLSHRLQPNWLPEGLDLQVPDLVPVIRAAPATRIELVAGWDDTIDVFHAQRVAGLPSVRVLALPGRTHLLTAELYFEGKLGPLITELVDGGTPEGCRVDPALEPDEERRIADTVFALKGEDWGTVVERIAPVAAEHEDWAGPNFDLGRGLAGIEDWEGAEAALRRAVDANPRWIEPRTALDSIRALQ
jgi:pimeloyl-ACP methyl ester carboxylesterase